MTDFLHTLDASGQLRPDQVTDLLIEVIGGRVLFESGGGLYASRAPRQQDQDQARIIYARRLRECQNRGIGSRAEMRARAIASGQFALQEVAEKANLLKTLDCYRDARAKTTDNGQKLSLDAEMERMQRRWMELEAQEAEVLVHSAEAIAEDARNDFLVSRCTLGGELLDEPVWATWADYKKCQDLQLIRDARAAHVRISAGLASNIIRALARSTEWKMRWRGAKDSHSAVFEGASGSWDSNKLQLIHWSEFYDAIAAHPHAPPPHVIEDDDALQEWLNGELQSRQQGHSRGQVPAAGPPPTYRDGTGQRRQMTRIGTERFQVNTPYKIRPSRVG
jgi:hypothetical protein